MKVSILNIIILLRVWVKRMVVLSSAPASEKAAEPGIVLHAHG